MGVQWEVEGQHSSAAPAWSQIPVYAGFGTNCRCKLAIVPWSNIGVTRGVPDTSADRELLNLQSAEPAAPEKELSGS